MSLMLTRKVQWDKWVSNLDNLGMVNIWNSSKPGLITMKLLNQKKNTLCVLQSELCNDVNGAN